jgi:hypothetical protein
LSFVEQATKSFWSVDGNTWFHFDKQFAPLGGRAVSYFEDTR